MSTVVTVYFEDHMQDFLSFVITDGIVTDCRPSQGWMWKGAKVHSDLAALHVGDKLTVSTKSFPGQPAEIKYPITKIIRHKPGKADKPYGFEVVYERRTTHGLEEAKFRLKGSENAARRAAILKRCYVRVIGVEPYTKEQYLRCFGEGKM